MENKFSTIYLKVSNFLKNKLGIISLIISSVLLLFFFNQMAIYDFIYRFIPLGPENFPFWIMGPITTISLILFVASMFLAIFSYFKKEKVMYSIISGLLILIEAIYLIFFTKLL